VQTLSPTLFLCFAPADRELAERIAAFVERGANVRILLDAGEMLPSEDLAEKARQAQGSDMALVLFSRASLPSRWPRAQWEDALVNEPAAEGLRIAFVKCDDCIPPRVLTPLFEANALRAIKRWVRGHLPPPHAGAPRDPDLEVLGIAIADRPGTELVDGAVAEQFILAYQQDFDAVFRLDCGERSLAAIAGDLAAQLELRLEGDAESNLAYLQDFCTARRFLIVLNDPGLFGLRFTFTGRTSTLLVSTVVTEPHDESIRGIQHGLRRPVGGWIEFSHLARIGRRITRDAGRIAECYEIVQCWHDAAEAVGDRAASDESARELVWILLSWDRPEEARHLDYRRACEFDEQMQLPFDR
jgi:TIR domain